MPELPEVERVRLSLEPHLVGATVTSVRVGRPDVVRPHGRRRGAARAADLLRGGTIRSLVRHGKQLAILADRGVVCVHLGMTGQLTALPPRRRIDPPDHVHCVWSLRGSTATRLVFRDPRRFGGIWTYPDRTTLEDDRWAALGPDALTLRTGDLAEALAQTRRAVKAALLDQTLVAGIGNIYADEMLFRTGVDPRTPADEIDRATSRRLAAACRSILRAALRSGGSSVRDYVDGEGERGSFVDEHRVYGRGGLPCTRCSEVLVEDTVGGRTTVWCARCQA